MPEPEDRTLSMREAAALFGVNRRTLYRWVTAAELSPVESVRSSGPAGMTTLWRLSELAAIVATRRAP